MLLQLDFERVRRVVVAVVVERLAVAVVAVGVGLVLEAVPEADEAGAQRPQPVLKVFGLAVRFCI